MPFKSPPERKKPDDYHYHVFDYAKSAPFKLSQGQPTRNHEEFYSLYEDMKGLRDYGADTGVPNIELISVGKNLGYPLVADLAFPSTLVLSFGNKSVSAPNVLITGGIHGREWVAVEVAYLIAEYLIRNYKAPPSHYQTMIRDLVNTRRIHIVPMLNPVGNSYTVFTPGDTARDWRKNRRPLPPGPSGWLKVLASNRPDATTPWNWPFMDVRLTGDGKNAQYSVPTYDPANRIPPRDASYEPRQLRNAETGVDLNRNFQTPAWGYDTKDVHGRFLNQWDPASETYFGPKALSEGEAGNITAFILGLPGNMVSIDYHSYGRFIIFPGEVADSGRIDADYKELGSVLEMLTETPDERIYKLGTPLQLVEYAVTGTIDNYLAEFRATRAFAVELDGGPGFNLPRTEIQQVFETNIRGVLAAISAGHQAAKDLILAWSEFKAWKVFGCGNQLPADTGGRT